MYSTYADLRKQVELDGNLHVTKMETLRDLHDAGRLGKHVRDGISAKLAEHGMGHLPQDLPAYQEEAVRIYRLGSPIADAINSVLNPSEGGDQVLREVAADKSRETLRRIRELACE